MGKALAPILVTEITGEAGSAATSACYHPHPITRDPK